MAEGESIFEGGNPLKVSEFSLLLVQLIIIILISRLFAVILRYFNQPRVLAEVLGGIVLGPTVLGRIPGFQETFFPESSMSTLKALAELGLVMFLFIVGLELELALLKTKVKAAVIVSAMGIVIPFAAGFAAAAVLWNTVGDGITVSFGVFAAFIAVANSITAFPVLARIVAEQKLLKTPVGLTSIAASALGDVVAWCFLAMVVAISKSNGSALEIVWVLLTTSAFALVMLLGVRPLLSKLLQSESAEKYLVSQATVVGAFVLAFFSAWIMEIVGVHAIFGAFLAGLIMPRHAGFAVRLIEKMEDFITIVLLPLYFTYSGLRTQIGTLNNGTAWGMVFLVIAAACTKIIAAGGAAKALKHTVRESLAIGILMNTRGLVELIVLNVGLDAGALNEETFVITVLMTLVTTFMTAPLLKRVYPASYAERREWKAMTRLYKDYNLEAMIRSFESRENVAMWLENNDDAGAMSHFLSIFAREPITMHDFDEDNERTSFSLQQPESLGKETPAMDPEAGGCLSEEAEQQPLITSVVRLYEISDRNSSVLRATWISEETPRDLKLFRVQCREFGFDPNVCMAITTPGSHAADLASTAALHAASFLVVPWVEPAKEMSFFAHNSNRNEIASELMKGSEVGVALFVSGRSRVALSSSAGNLVDSDGSYEHGMPASEVRNLFRMSDAGLSINAEEPCSHSYRHCVQSTLSIPQHGRGPLRRVVAVFIGGHDNRSAVWMGLQMAKMSTCTLVHVVHLLSNKKPWHAQPTTRHKKNEHDLEPLNKADRELASDATFIQFVQSLMDGGADYVSLTSVETSLSLDIALSCLANGNSQREPLTGERVAFGRAPSLAGLTATDLGGPDPWSCPVSLFLIPHRCPAIAHFASAATAVAALSAAGLDKSQSNTVAVPLGTHISGLNPDIVNSLGSLGATLYALPRRVPLLVVKAPVADCMSSPGDTV